MLAAALRRSPLGRNVFIQTVHDHKGSSRRVQATVSSNASSRPMSVFIEVTAASVSGNSWMVALFAGKSWLHCHADNLLHRPDRRAL